VSADNHFQEEAALTALGPLETEKLNPDPEALVSIVEDETVPLPRRIAAGSLLGLCGDPRTGGPPRLVPVPGGTVRIGLEPSSVDEVVARWRHVGVERDWILKEAPARDVTLAGFALARYPVTNSEYREFLVQSGHPTRPSTWYLGAYPWDRANHPVCGLAETDVDAYLRWLSDRHGHAYRLPTEAEWEHAAKGFDGREFPWGDEFDPALANTRESGIHTTTPVGAYPAGASPFGLLDMAGNVEEYVADEYAPYPGGIGIVDHLVETLGRYRVSRGGSFARFGDLARTRRRHGAFPGPLYPCGFRVAADDARSTS
jgi:formylglycine-generating enzyme required for sulfatase activity